MTTKVEFNSRQRKAMQVMAYIWDANNHILDVINPGVANHRMALGWAEWRMASIPSEYPEFFRMSLYCGNDFIAEITV